ncbi:MAG: hypothetical protein NZL85_03650, partial [Fimbriimonadales bacterium]|nr:hypothetical protein [Fimbriimonadales bacterium]
ICPETPIPYYDRKMDTVRAMEIAPAVVAQLAQHMRTSFYREVFLAMGLLYRRAVEPVQAWLPPETRLIAPKGGIGTVAAQLKDWLEREHSA